MRNPNVLSTPDAEEIENQEKYDKYVKYLERHLKRLSDVDSGKALPVGETLELNYDTFKKLKLKIEFLALRYSKAQALIGFGERIDKHYKELLAGKASNKELESAPRNNFEIYLIAEGFPEADIRKFDADTQERMRSFVLSKSLEKVIKRVEWTTMTVGLISELPFPSPQLKITMMEVLSSITFNLKGSPEEMKARVQLQANIQRDFSTIDMVFSLGNEMKKTKPGSPSRKQQSITELKSDIFANPRIKTLFNEDTFINGFGGLPPLLDEDGRRENISLGDAFFLTFKEINRAGKKWEVDPVTGWIRPKKVLSPHLAPSEKNLAVYPTNDRHHTIQFSIEAITNDEMDQSVAPEQEAGEHRHLKPFAIDRLRAIASMSDPMAFESSVSRRSKEFIDKDKYPRTTQGDVATMLAYHTALVSLVLAEMDNVNFSPVGAGGAEKASHPTAYANKILKSGGKEGPTNAAMVGRVKTFVKSFLKFAVMGDGRTLEQAVMSANSWKDLKIENWPRDITSSWLNMIITGLGEYERAENGLGAGKLFSLAKMNWEEGRTIIDDKIVDDIHSMIRNAYKYHIERDMSMGEVLIDSKKFLESYDTYLPDGSLNPEFVNRRPPSEEFYVITVLTADAKIDPNTGRFIPDDNLIRRGISARQQEEMNVKRMITRFPGYYFAPATRLGLGVDYRSFFGKQIEKDGYDLRRVVKAIIDPSGRQVLEPTGQIEGQISITLGKGIPIIDEGKKINNSPQMLVKRLIVENVLAMLLLKGDVMAHLSKEDYLPLGMFFSPEIREKYKNGHYGKLNDLFLAKMEKTITTLFGIEHSFEFFRREDPGIIGDSIYTEELFRAMLGRLGFRISKEDWEKPFNILSGNKSDSGHKKH